MKAWRAALWVWGGLTLLLTLAFLTIGAGPLAAIEGASAGAGRACSVKYALLMRVDYTSVKISSSGRRDLGSLALKSSVLRYPRDTAATAV